jgi:hypothetical protein
LLGRDGRLIFQPSPPKDKRARRVGGLFFIWNETTHSGYVLSEALQGYAPIQSDAGAASPLNITKEGIQEDIDGHSCHRYAAVVALNNGLNARLTLWQADDAGHFPIRIETASGPDRITLDFSEVRLEYAALKLFFPPEGFTAYGSSVVMMNELIARESNLAEKNQTGQFDEPTDVRPANIHQPDPSLH